MGKFFFYRDGINSVANKQLSDAQGILFGEIICLS